jgi:hypothetical protein
MGAPFGLNRRVPIGVILAALEQLDELIAARIPRRRFDGLLLKLMNVRSRTRVYVVDAR